VLARGDPGGLPNPSLLSQPTSSSSDAATAGGGGGGGAHLSKAEGGDGTAGGAAFEQSSPTSCAVAATIEPAGRRCVEAERRSRARQIEARLHGIDLG
jgi:hypothetical protein